MADRRPTEDNPGILDKLIGYLLGNEKRNFREVHIDASIVEEIICIARESHPKEFAALLEGKITDEILTIQGLIFLPGKSSSQGAVMQTFMKPLITGTVGSVHSHPTYNPHPSNADLYVFSKNGIVHLIIAKPYDEYSLRAYDNRGIEISYKII
ncbi:MAG TPA: Mov34/MPN/PAD-1 family protein [Methanobacteriaceae archaeon]|jgi:proteasome lid subunit RPN8/RPN11|nr:Mov34/MPN/PAD-1 family protein [Euryarchaeota archaeon]HNR26466.1 Mov34/MPN/PAD-1 family protein [Methanobacteriaceae archaeon]